MKRILLIDDDVILGEVIQSLLKDEGFDVIIQEDSQQITEVIKKNSPELIILDYFLPTENGEEVARRLKSNPQTKNIPIIMISSHYGIESVARKVGVDAFLPKPFDVDKLIRLAHTFIG